MMWIQRITVSVFFLLVISSCHKNTSDLGPDFHHFVGHWKNLNGDDEINIYINENGKVEMHCSIERGKKYRIQELGSIETQDVNGIPWKEYTYYHTPDDYDTYLRAVVGTSFDTVQFYLNGKQHPTQNDTLANNVWIEFVKV